MRLPESPVMFDHTQHRYNLYGQELRGVTAVVRWLFPDQYKDIPAEVLSRAAGYGTRVHSLCEMYDSGICDAEDMAVQEYARLIKEAGLTVVCSEYLVSDEHHVASMIDKVFEDDSLGDIKTTSKVHVMPVTVQLSIYAWLYERQTGRQVNRLYVVWLPKPMYGTAGIYEMERIPSEVCEYVVEEYAKGGSNKDALRAIATCGISNEIKNNQLF